MTYKELEKITGLTARKIRFYGDQGLISFEDEQHPGRGVGREYEWKNLFELLIIKELAANGVQLGTVKEALKKLNNDFPGALEKVTYQKQVVKFLLVYPSKKVGVFTSREAMPPELITNLSDREAVRAWRVSRLKGNMILKEEASVVLVDLNQLAEKLL